MRGKYNPPVLVELPPTVGVTVVQPMSGEDDCLADAVYVFAERRASSGKWLWKLQRIEEWLPPMSPQEKAERYTEQARLPPLTPDGRIDFVALAARREREWREHEAPV